MTNDGRTSLPTLYGSETQTASATRIRSEVDAGFTRVRQAVEADSNKYRPLDRSETISLLALIEEHRAAVLCVQDAQYFISEWHDPSRVEKALAEDKRWKIIQEARSSRRARVEGANPVRYIGFDDAAGTRIFKFGRLPRHDDMEIFTVTVPVAMFLKHRISFQDGPAMCSAIIAGAAEPKNHTMTDEDGLEFVSKRAVKVERKPPRQKFVQPQ